MPPLPISPLAPKTYPTLPPIAGVRLSAKACGVKYRNRVDVMVAELAEGTTVAGAFTRSKTCSANIIWGQKILSHGKARVLVVNSGNANAFNGKNGEDSIDRIVAACAKEFGCDPKEVYPSSTGVIGVPLADNKITESLGDLKSLLHANAWEEAAKAIMTTDTFHKMVTRTAMIDGVKVTINGITKGSGMIAPDMATMLAYFFTDAGIPAPILQEIFSAGIETSFNAITVDSDTSTSDTALIFATGQAKHKAITSANDPALTDFKAKLREIQLELAHLIVRDGEGATKFVAIHVKGAESDRAAKVVGMAIANSPLVKTALAGGDPNWGRIVAAVGKSGEAANRDTLTIGIGYAILAKNGQLNPDYVESHTTAYMKGENIDIYVDLGLGQGAFTVWTCDLTHGYISINVDYRS
ncbi:MAG: argJ [Rickettsiales bacterium]|jgi:glutamate N-acetyltransferase/amino-acid N-acetyltransferase|nr:argJ [Rickettsiales bacterium]